MPKMRACPEGKGRTEAPTNCTWPLLVIPETKATVRRGSGFVHAQMAGPAEGPSQRPCRPGTLTAVADSDTLPGPLPLHPPVEFVQHLKETLHPAGRRSANTIDLADRDLHHPFHSAGSTWRCRPPDWGPAWTARHTSRLHTPRTQPHFPLCPPDLGRSTGHSSGPSLSTTV